MLVASLHAGNWKIMPHETANSPVHVVVANTPESSKPQILMRPESASPTRVVNHEGASEEDDDGVLFGSRSDRRVFFAGSGSNRQIAAVAADVLGARQRAPSKDPLHALGLFPSSPYAVLRKNAPVAVAAAHHDDSTARTRRSNSPPQQQYPTSTGTGAFGKDIYAPLDPLWTTVAETAYGGKHYPSPGPTRYQQTACAIYRGHCRRNVEAGPRSSTCSVGDESFEEDPSAVLLREKIRADQKATGEEAARLRQEADASVMIRRFWRYSG